MYRIRVTEGGRSPTGVTLMLRLKNFVMHPQKQEKNYTKRVEKK